MVSSLLNISIIFAYSGQKEVAKYLIENGADLNAQNSIGSTPLQWATTDGCRIPRNSPVSYVDNTDILKMLIANGANIDIKNHFGATALNWAVRNREHHIFCILFNNTSDRKFQLIFFEWSIYSDKEDGVKILLDSGADVNIQDDTGYTPLHWATKEGRFQVWRDRVFFLNKSFFKLNSYSGFENIVKILIENGA